MSKVMADITISLDGYDTQILPGATAAPAAVRDLVKRSNWESAWRSTDAGRCRPLRRAVPGRAW
jgi:hypothetical protein